MVGEPKRPSDSGQSGSVCPLKESCPRHGRGECRTRAATRRFHKRLAVKPPEAKESEQRALAQALLHCPFGRLLICKALYEPLEIRIAQSAQNEVLRLFPGNGQPLLRSPFRSAGIRRQLLYRGDVRTPCRFRE